jgi:hypothetical protein
MLHNFDLELQSLKQLNTEICLSSKPLNTKICQSSKPLNTEICQRYQCIRIVSRIILMGKKIGHRATDNRNLK